MSFHDLNELKDTTNNAQSSAEAELYAIGTTMIDVIYVRNFLHELKFTQDDQMTLHNYTDSSSASCLTQQLVLTKTTKHSESMSLTSIINYHMMENYAFTKRL
eukprot:339397-Amphidinium_carterae.1